MLRLIKRSVLPSLFVASCGGGFASQATTAADHERLAQHYDAVAGSIENQCWLARRNELTVVEPATCWKAQDKRFLDANRDAAAQHRAAAVELRTRNATASR